MVHSTWICRFYVDSSKPTPPMFHTANIANEDSMILGSNLLMGTRKVSWELTLRFLGFTPIFGPCEFSEHAEPLNKSKTCQNGLYISQTLTWSLSLQLIIFWNHSCRTKNHHVLARNEVVRGLDPCRTLWHLNPHCRRNVSRNWMTENMQESPCK